MLYHVLIVLILAVYLALLFGTVTVTPISAFGAVFPLFTNVRKSDVPLVGGVANV